MENLLPHVIKKIGQEIRQLMLNPIEGITLLTNEQEIADIQVLRQIKANIIFTITIPLGNN